MADGEDRRSYRPVHGFASYLLAPAFGRPLIISCDDGVDELLSHGHIMGHISFTFANFFYLNCLFMKLVNIHLQRFAWMPARSGKSAHVSV